MLEFNGVKYKNFFVSGGVGSVVNVEKMIIRMESVAGLDKQEFIKLLEEILKSRENEKE